MGGAVSGLVDTVGDTLSSGVDAYKSIQKPIFDNAGLIGTGVGAYMGGPMGAKIGGMLGGAVQGGLGDNGSVGGALGGAALGGLAGTAAGMFSSPQTAAAPDYMALAKQQSAASRTNQNGPFGSISYTENPNGTWTQNTSYDPAVQKAMMSQYSLANAQNDTLQNALNSGMFNNMGKIDTSGFTGYRGIDTSGIAKMPVNAGMTAQNAIMSRLQPQIQQRDESLQQRLANQGIGEGSEAYKRAMTQQSQANNDLLTQAASQGIGIDMTANNQGFGQQQALSNNAMQQRAQQLNEATGLANQGLNYFNALRGGSQVNAPQFGAINGSGANLLGAGQAGYQANLNNANANNAYKNNMMGGMMGIGGQILSNPSLMNSIGGMFNTGGGGVSNSGFDWSGLGQTDQYWL